MSNCSPISASEIPAALASGATIGRQSLSSRDVNLWRGAFWIDLFRNPSLNKFQRAFAHRGSPAFRKGYHGLRQECDGHWRQIFKLRQHQQTGSTRSGAAGPPGTKLGGPIAPNGVVEAIWSGVAIYRWRIRTQ